MACVIAVALVNVISKDRIMRLLSSAVNVRALQEWYRDQQEALQGSAYLLALVYLLSTSSFFFLAQMAFPHRVGGLEFLPILGIVAGAFLIKNLGLLALQDIADGKFGLLIYRFEYVVIAQVQGITLLPFAILAAYIGKGQASFIIMAGFAVVLAFFLFRIVRGITHALRLRVPLFYIIFYLCALEFLPLAALVSAVLR